MSTLTSLLGQTDPETPADTLTDAMATVEAAIRSQPRSQQRLIGPSEIGEPCLHCLAAKLAGIPQVERDVPWAPWIGTAMHAELARIFEADAEKRSRLGQPKRWRVEEKVYVGMIGGHPIRGTCDLFDVHTGTVLDWKCTAAASLKAARRGPKPVYRAQAHLYGLGWENAGAAVETVAIAHLPRTSMRIDDAVLWSEPYDRQIALDAIARADRLATNLRALASISAGTRDAWIASLDRAPGCFSCPRYPDWNPPSPLATELGLTTSSTDRKAA